jgi:hypothetical protein
MGAIWLWSLLVVTTSTPTMIWLSTSVPYGRL